ncbi:MAG: hypothetical protein HN952_04435 [Candidatus Cloacimonetes bacterium]|jgi:hypothetical protein|nr:hypothetical protein [Candidatus Cloacimonadota bacterium]MBT6994186.1 hypothetical protein [Candidatus Cloacimonadota bacterium]MBT7469725.1 hypothetical protein [Candidatus Cloacimonadota bacterium]
MFNFKNVSAKWAVLLLILITVSCTSTTDNDDDNPDGNGDYLFVINNGAQTMRDGETITYTASLVDIDGNVTVQTSVNWASSNEEIATINDGTISTVDIGTTEITASISVDGINYVASVPLAIRLASPMPYLVMPQTIIALVGDTIDLEVITFSAEDIVPTFSSNNSNIASVNSNGLVTANAMGFAEVNAAYEGMNFLIPVLVVGLPEINFPIVNVSITSGTCDLFVGEHSQFTATAIDNEGQSVETDFEWISTDTAVATVDQNGNVTAISVGETKIQAIANGIIGEIECRVLPDTIIIVTPFLQDIGIGESFTFNAQAYSLKNEQYLPELDDFYWFIPQYPPPFDQFFNNASVDQDGTVNVELDAMPGMMGFVLVSFADDVENPLGCGVYMVNIGWPLNN